MVPHPSVLTKRLLLRAFELDDAAAMEVIASKMRTLAQRAELSLPEVAGEAPGWVLERQRLWNTGLGVSFAVCERAAPRLLVGEVQLVRDADNQSAEVGFWVSPDRWRSRIASEALSAVVGWAFEVFELHRICGRTLEGNVAAQRVMRSAGLSYEGKWRAAALVGGEYLDVFWFSVLREEVSSIG